MSCFSRVHNASLPDREQALEQLTGRDEAKERQPTTGEALQLKSESCRWSTCAAGAEQQQQQQPASVDGSTYARDGSSFRRKG